MYEVNSIYTYKRLVTAKVNRCHLMTCVWLLGAINHTCCVVGRGRSRERRASLGGWATAHRPDGRLAGGWNWMSPAGTLADAAAAADRFQIRSRNGTRPAGRRPRSSSTRPIRLHPSIHPCVRTPSGHGHVHACATPGNCAVLQSRNLLNSDALFYKLYIRRTDDS